MARTINEPLPTPVRPSASSTRARSQLSSHTGSRIPLRTINTSRVQPHDKTQPVSQPRQSAVHSRAVLGERLDNASSLPSSHLPNRKYRPSQIIVNPISAPATANSPARSPTSSIRGPFENTSTALQGPRPSFNSLDAGMNEDVTQLLDYQPSSPSGATTDDGWFSGAEEVGNLTAGRTPMPRKSVDGWGRAVEGRGRIMTPMNSQEIQVRLTNAKRGVRFANTTVARFYIGQPTS
jgi:hypothetical protein